jgi:cytochrome c-type biogenesis protein
MDVSLLAAFGAGLASFASPCVLPLVPVYFASLCGPEILDQETSISRAPILLHSVSFILGFSIVFVLMGALVGLAGIIINPASPLMQNISGSLLVAFGVFMLAAWKIPWLNYEKRLIPSMGTTSGYLRSFLTGSIFCLAWTPCVSPLLGSVLTLAWRAHTAWKGAYLLTVYSLGLGLPFLVIGSAFGTITPLLRRIYRYSVLVYIISGALLIAVGILILTGKLAWLMAILT